MCVLLQLEVALHAAWVVGSACKYAPELQAAALTRGAMHGLLQLLRRGLDEMAVPVPGPAAGTSSGGRSSALAAAGKAVYALGALLRGKGGSAETTMAHAQFMALGGVPVCVRQGD